MNKLFTKLLDFVRGVVAKEPVMVATVVGAAVNSAIAWGLPIDPAAKAGIILAVCGLIMRWARGRVAPVKKA